MSERWVNSGHAFEALRLPRHAGLRQPGSRRRPGPAALMAESSAVLRSAGVIARRARRHDLVQSSSLWAHLETAIGGRLARRPVVLDLHDIVEDGPGRRVLRAAAGMATTTLANSAATAATVAPRASVHIVHPGVNTARFHPGPQDPVLRAQLTSKPSAPLIAILGRVDPSKGIDVVVRAVTSLSGLSSPPHLVVIGREHVGSSGEARTLRELATAQLGERVRFLDPRDDVPDVLRSVDVLVNASDCEPFGLTVLEAQACGVPVVGTRAGGIPEFVDHEQTGLLVPPRDATALARALHRLLEDQALRHRLTAAATDQALTRFSIESQAAATGRVYRLMAGMRAT